MNILKKYVHIHSNVAISDVDRRKRRKRHDERKRGREWTTGEVMRDR